MISLIIGTLNRKKNLELLVENTIDKSDHLELVIVDGGSTDGTIEYLQSLNNEKINLIQYGKKSSYSHFMNLGIKNSKYQYICQWNTDAILINSWDEVINQITENYDCYVFNWKLAKNINFINNKNWLSGNDFINGWMILDNTKKNIDYGIDGEIVMNYGIYNKKIFKNIGRFNRAFRFYFADAELSNRAYYFGYKFKILRDVKVLVLDSPKSREPKKSELNLYKTLLRFYKFLRRLKKTNNLK